MVTKNTSTKVSSGKSGGGFSGSMLSGKSSSSKSSTPKSSFGLGELGSSSSGKSSAPFVASSYKSYSVQTTPKSKKSSGFGIIWIPTKKHKKKKDVIYTGHNDSYPKAKYERTPSMYNFMSGGSLDLKPPKKKEEEIDLLMPERSNMAVATITAAGTATTSSDIPTDNLERSDEKQEFIKRDSDETKEAAGDSGDKSFKNDKNDDYLDNDKTKNKFGKQDNEKSVDKVDSVYLRPPPTHKTKSNDSIAEEDDCGINCLYYTLQCCECVIM